MTGRDLLAAAFCAGLVACPPFAKAQTPAETGTGGGPSSTIYAPNTTSVGKTKPPGRAAGAGEPMDGNPRTLEQVEEDKVMKGICIGCGVK